MKRIAGAFMLMAGLSGCMTPEKTGPASTFGQVNSARRELDHVQGPQGVPVAVGYNGVAQVNTPHNVQASYTDAGNGGGVQQAGLFRNTGYGSNGGCTNCGPNGGGSYAGGGGGVGGASDLPHFHPGKGIVPVPFKGPDGAVAAVGALPGGYPQMPLNARTSVRFADPAGMKITWFGPNGLNDIPLETPARYNFLQGGIYRLKVWSIQNQPGLELYPTLEVAPATPKTATYLAHSSVPVSFTDEDFAQVASGNFLVKVIYLPDPQFQDISTVAGPSEVVSSRLEAGADPIVEAQKRGSILLIVRLGNIDLQAPNSPAMNAPNPYMMGMMQPMPAQQGQMMPQGAPMMPQGQMAQQPPVMPRGMTGNPAMTGTPRMMPTPGTNSGSMGSNAPPITIPAPNVSMPTTPGAAPPLTMPTLPEAKPVPALPTGRPNVLPTLQ